MSEADDVELAQRAKRRDSPAIPQASHTSQVHPCGNGICDDAAHPIPLLRDVAQVRRPPYPATHRFPESCTPLLGAHHPIPPVVSFLHVRSAGIGLHSPTSSDQT